MKQLYMQKYLELEIKRFKEMGWEFPPELVALLNKRAKALDKNAAAEQARKVYSKEKAHD